MGSSSWGRFSPRTRAKCDLAFILSTPKVPPRCLDTLEIFSPAKYLLFGEFGVWMVYLGGSSHTEPQEVFFFGCLGFVFFLLVETGKKKRCGFFWGGGGGFSVGFCQLKSWWFFGHHFFATHFGGWSNLMQMYSMVVSGSPKRWDRWHSPSPNWQEKYHLYIYHLYIAFWGVICYLPPFRGTRNNHWCMISLRSLHLYSDQILRYSDASRMFYCIAFWCLKTTAFCIKSHVKSASCLNHRNWCLHVTAAAINHS